MSGDIAGYERSKELCEAVFLRLDQNCLPSDQSPDPTSCIELADQFFDQWLLSAEHEEAWQLGLEGIRQGFRVIGRGIERCKEAYEFYCNEHEEAYLEERLVAALNHPKTLQTFTWLASIGERDNAIYELWLGLKQNRTLKDEFIYYDGPGESGWFIPNPEHMTIAKADTRSMARRHHEAVDIPVAPHKICSARHYIPKVWKDTVRAAQEHGLLSGDILDEVL